VVKKPSIRNVVTKGLDQRSGVTGRGRGDGKSVGGGEIDKKEKEQTHIQEHLERRRLEVRL